MVVRFCAVAAAVLALAQGLSAQREGAPSTGCRGITCSVDVTRPGCSSVAASPGGTAALPVFIYPTSWPYEAQAMNPYVTHVIRWLRFGPPGRSAVAVDDPGAACLFLVTAPAAALCNSSRMDCGFYELWQAHPFSALAHWWEGSGGGR